MDIFKRKVEIQHHQITFLFLVAGFLILLGNPIRSNAAIWSDADGGNIDQVVSNVKSIIDKINSAQTTIADGKVQGMISDVRVILDEALAAQQDGVQDFLMGGNCVANDGTPCGMFRADLLYFLETIENINNQLLAMHDIPSLDIQIEDPGLANLLNKIPGRILFPLYKVMSRTKLMDPAFISALEEVPAHLENAKMVLLQDTSESPVASTSYAFNSTSSLAVSVPGASNTCLIIQDRPLAFNVASNFLTGVGILNRIIGAVLEAMGETFIGGPAEVDAGIHGYVHGTIKTSTLGTMGKIASGVGGVMQAIGGSISGKITFCGIELRQVDILRGQKEILCAMKNNNLSGCEEFIGNGFDNHGVGGTQSGRP